MQRIFIIVCCVGLLLCSCNTGKEQSYNARIYRTEIDQFGYDIYKDSVLVIHQPIIPGIEGNRGFKTKEDAAQVAALVILKLEKGIMLPSVTLKELDSLNVAK